MKKVQINGKRIGIDKVFEVPVSFGLVDDLSKWQIRLREDDIKNLEQQIEFEKQSSEAEKTEQDDNEASEQELTPEQRIKVIEQEIKDVRSETKPINDLIEFYRDVLHLSPKEVKVVKYSCDESDLGTFMVYLNLMVNGLTTEEAFNKAMEPSSETKGEKVDPKKEEAN